jgi:hypothetical protein
MYVVRKTKCICTFDVKHFRNFVEFIFIAGKIFIHIPDASIYFYYAILNIVHRTSNIVHLPHVIGVRTA